MLLKNYYYTALKPKTGVYNNIKVLEEIYLTPISRTYSNRTVKGLIVIPITRSHSLSIRLSLIASSVLPLIWSLYTLRLIIAYLFTVTNS